MSMSPIFGRQQNRAEEGEHWLTVSDLMAGLMMVFLFIAIVFMRNTTIENKKMKEIAVAYQDNQVAIYNSLNQEFKADLDTWGAEINQETLSFDFKSPEVLFDNGKQTLKPAFEEILQDFFPRYLKVLRPFRESIDEVRIEGHTSSSWGASTDATDAYFFNMTLSQGRTRSVLNYVYGLSEVLNQRNWIKRRIAAVGFSSSRLVLNEDGSENIERSRRVSFRVITNAEIQIRKIIEG